MADEKSDAEVAAVLSKFSKSHLECVICHERYREPKMLACLHNFCERCLAAYQESSGDPFFIKCPVCRQKMKFAAGTDIVASLKTNFHLVSMVEDFTLQEQLTQPKAMKVICELCMDQKEAKSRCMDCPFFLCASCQTIHQRIYATAGHDIVALDTLRSGAVSLRSKVQDEPPCEKHRGEKKRFFCLTCDQLICRDCTVVEHRDSAHEFIAVAEAAVRFRKNIKELIQNCEENLAAYPEASTELTKMTTDLESSMLLGRQLVTEQAAEETGKIAKREENFSTDIAKRQKLRLKVMHKVGIKIRKSLTNAETKPAELPPVKDENEQKYSKTIDEKFASLDSSLTAFCLTAESLRKSDDDIEDLRVILESEAAKDIAEDKSKVATNLDHFLRSIQDTFELRKSMIKEVGKMTSAETAHMRQTLETACEVVKSSSDVDFLNLHTVINISLRVLLVQSPPRLPLGYSKMVFKSSNDTALGELILGATWKFARQISTKYTNYSMATFSNDAILVSRSDGYLQGFRTAGNSYQDIHLGYGGPLATFPDGETTCRTVTAYSTYVDLYSNSGSKLKRYTAPGSVEQDGSQINIGQPVNMAYYRNQEIVISYSNWQGIVVFDTSNGSTVREIPVDIKPDFLACTSRGRILVASRKPACVECLDGNDATSLTIHPTVAGSTGGEKEVICSGLCRDSRDVIYVAVSLEGANEIHIHQYTLCGSFIGCLTSGNISQPIIDIGVTGNGTLVVAEQNTRLLKLFETPKEEVTL